ncbi:hypothetical protein PG987_009697 [Apiospora arundinis]
MLMITITPFGSGSRVSSPPSLVLPPHQRPSRHPVRPPRRQNHRRQPAPQPHAHGHVHRHLALRRPQQPGSPRGLDPCLGISDPATGETRYIYESASILAYLETVYGNSHAGANAAMPRDDPVDVATMHDVIGMINLAMLDSGYYTRHAVPALAAWSGLANEDRSGGAARNARASMAKSLGKVQIWAAPSLKATGWLTPGTGGGPGLADFCLAAARRYLELTFGWDIFEGEGKGNGEDLKELVAWYERFKGLDWWEAAEEHVIVQPPQLRMGKESREF